ncbi:gas vesicle protein [Actinomadura sp. NBRC 104425]|uniref:gas vesicle protein n=1 Tax=Actinomadura sp. NBRC 104425 TaxID=3032204 RepID=UPI00255443F1|nr:gas vesicle protein [Actinomadura sp. NBRC 104425]
MPYTGARGPIRPAGERTGTSLADLLERILDKGIVIVGDIRVNLLDIELLTVKLRLLVASVDRAKEMGIDWWEHDPSLSSRARAEVEAAEQRDRLEHDRLAEENRLLRERLAALEAAAPPARQVGDRPAGSSGEAGHGGQEG